MPVHPTAAPLPERLAWVFPAYSLGVIDGDSFHAVLDLGFGLSFRPEKGVRLNGIDVIERHEPRGAEARQFTETWLHQEERDPVSPSRLLYPLRLTIVARRLDKYGRFRADVVRVRDGASLAEALRAAGFEKLKEAA